MASVRSPAPSSSIAARVGAIMLAAFARPALARPILARTVFPRPVLPRPVSPRPVSPRLALFAAFVGLLLFGALAAPPSARAATEASAEDVRLAMERIVERGRHQMELPKKDPPEPREPLEPFNLELGVIGEILLYLVLAGAAVFIVATLLRQKIAPARRGAVREAASSTVRPAPRAPTATELADAEAAALAEAAEGRFDLAIHLLLLGAIGRLRERDARSTARHLTSREILTRVFTGPEEGAARAALRALVAAVEISRFGGRAADRAAFDACLAAYRALRRSIGSTGPAPVVATAPQTA